jgi:hypothetical protein
MREVTFSTERRPQVDLIVLKAQKYQTRNTMRMEHMYGKVNFNGVGTWFKRTKKGVLQGSLQVLCSLENGKGKGVRHGLLMIDC